MTFFPEKLLSHILQTMLQKGSFPLNWITPASIEFPGILVFLKAERNMLHILALQSAVLLFGGKHNIYLFIYLFFTPSAHVSTSAPVQLRKCVSLTKNYAAKHEEVE